MIEKLSNPKKLIAITTFGLFLFLAVACGKSRNESSNTKKYESTTPSFTCKNCGNNKFHYHETVTDMKVCNSCGFGQ
jgi:ribosomal protein L37E